MEIYANLYAHSVESSTVHNVERFNSVLSGHMPFGACRQWLPRAFQVQVQRVLGNSQQQKEAQRVDVSGFVRTKWTLGVREKGATFVRETNPLQGLAKAVAQMLAPAQRYLVGRHRAIYEALEARKAKMRQNRERRALQLLKVQYVGASLRSSSGQKVAFGEVRKTLKKPKVTVQVHWAMA